MQSKAIAYFSNGIGNFVMMTPALKALSEIAGSTVDICLDDKWHDGRRKPIEDICKAWDVIGEVKSYPSDKLGDYDHWFYTPHNGYSEAVPLFMERQTNPPIARPDWRRALIHEEDWYMQSLYAMGYKGATPEKVMPCSGTQWRPDKSNVIGICNGAFSADYWKKKKWPYFKDLVSVLKTYFNCCVVGVGGEHELDDIPVDENFAGKLSITESATVIGLCDLFITTDTGCMHIADALDVPMIALFGSTLVSKNTPKSRKAKILRSTMECAPCQGDGKFWSCEVNACMESITPGDVMATAREMIRSRCGDKSN